MTQPLYFNLSLFNQQYDLAVEALADAIAKSDSAKGEICFNEYPSVKVKYDLDTGKITLAPTEGTSPYIKSVFPAKSFPFIVGPVADAISLCAKRKLLESLNELDEAFITSVIAKHTKKGKEVSFSRHAANKALISLQNRKWFSLVTHFLGASQAKVSDASLKLASALKVFGIENFTSHNTVDQFMSTLNLKKSIKKRGKSLPLGDD